MKAAADTTRARKGSATARHPGSDRAREPVVAAAYSAACRNRLTSALAQIKWSSCVLASEPRERTGDIPCQALGGQEN
eukprot:2522030-Rhodomonas_salina.1